MIKQEGDKWVLYSKDGSKKLGTFDTEEEAKAREAAIKRLEQATAEADSGNDTTECPFCGARMYASAETCPECGNAIPADEGPDAGTAQGEADARPTPLPKRDKALAEIRRNTHDALALLREIRGAQLAPQAAVAPATETDPVGMPQSYAQMDAGEQLWKTVYDLPGLLDTILWSEQDNTAKLAAIEALAAEFLGRMRALLPVVANATVEPPAAPAATEAAPAAPASGTNVPEPAPVAELALATSPAGEPVTLNESACGHATQRVEISEADTQAAGGDVSGIAVDVELIQPGWGNKRDNNYYPADVLRRDAQRFVGKKMYETDHRADEYSTRTAVAVIEDIVGFTDSGAPIARTWVYKPHFAQELRNLAARGHLPAMECSIRADGVAEAGFEQGGRKGRRVNAITEVHSVDWVTRAGAGGHAAALAESEPVTAPTTTTSETTGTAPDTAPTSAAESTHTEVTYLAAEVVKDRLAATHLPQAARARLAERQHRDAAALDAAITQEIAYLKEITGSGQPFGLGPRTAATPADTREAEAARLQRQDALLFEAGWIPPQAAGTRKEQ